VIHVMYVGLTIEADATLATPAGRSAGTPAAAICRPSVDAVRRKPAGWLITPHHPGRVKRSARRR
jgi:hypothetical protein